MADVKVTNRSAGIVVYKIPEKSIRREFQPKETKLLSEEEIRDAVAQEGVRALFYHYLFVEDEDILHDIVDVQEEAEYWLDEKQIPTWMQTCSIDQFADALDFAPQGIKDLIKKYAIELPLNDVTKRDLIKEKLGCDITQILANLAAEQEDDAPKQTTSKRRSSADYKNGETVKTPQYKVISKKA